MKETGVVNWCCFVLSQKEYDGLLPLSRGPLSGRCADSVPRKRTRRHVDGGRVWRTCRQRRCGQDQIQVSCCGQDQIQVSCGQDQIQVSCCGQDQIQVSCCGQDQIQVSWSPTTTTTPPPSLALPTCFVFKKNIKKKI